MVLRGHRVPFFAALALCGLLLHACAPKALTSGSGPPLPTDAPPPAQPPSNETLMGWINARNAELARLQVLESRGVLEFRWRDDQGEHFEQVDADLYLAFPDRAALRLSKLGEKYFWAGGDGARWWVFDLHAKPSRVEVFRDEDGPHRGGFGLLEPGCIRALAGIERIPESAECTAEGCVRWIRNGVTRTMRFDASGLPASVTLADAEGKLVASSTLRDFVSVPVDNIAMGAWPRIALRTEAKAPEGGEVKLALDAPSGRAVRIKPSLFDLESLLKALHPDEVITRSKRNGVVGPTP